MFRAFFSAIRGTTAALESLTASIREADANWRANLGLDAPADEPAALPAPDESEKAGRDIGFERALTDWIIKHRSKWRKSRQAVGTN